MVVYPHNRVADGGAVTCGHCPASGESIILYITSLGKDQNSKCRAWFLLNMYSFPTICKVKKNHKLNHCKSGAVCMLFYHLYKNTHEKFLPFTADNLSFFWVTSLFLLLVIVNNLIQAFQTPFEESLFWILLIGVLG